MSDWQLRLPDRGLIIGADTDYRGVEMPAPAGLAGSAPVRAHDVQLDLTHGVSAGRDTYDMKVISYAVLARGAGIGDSAKQTDARSKMVVIDEAWGVGDDTRLEVELPGQAESTLTYFGRTRARNEGVWLWSVGMMLYVLDFAATDPLAYGEERALDDQSGTFTIPAADTGHARLKSERAVITIHGDGGQPLLINADDDSGWIEAQATVGVGVDLVLDLSTMTASIDDVVVNQLIAPSSTWFGVVGGIDNELTLSGADSLDITWRPAYH